MARQDKSADVTKKPRQPGGDGDDGDDAAAAILLYDRQSRLFAAAGFSHLATIASQKLQHRSDVDQKGAIQRSSRRWELFVDGSEVSSSSNVSIAKSKGGPTSSASSSSYQATLTKRHRHLNPRCTVCHNALFRGLNCSTVTAGVICLTCQSVLPREKPKSESKRMYRSVRCRARPARSRTDTQPLSASAKASLPLQRPSSPIVDIPAATLHQRLAERKREAKEAKRRGKEEQQGGGPAVVDRQAGIDSFRTADAKSKPDNEKGNRVETREKKTTTVPLKRKTADHQSKDQIRRLLDDKKRKTALKQTQKSTTPTTSGLQDFLTSL